MTNMKMFESENQELKFLWQ